MSQRLSENFIPLTDPQTPLWSVERLCEEVDIQLDPLDIPKLCQRNEALKRQRNHGPRNQLTCWILTQPLSCAPAIPKTSIDSNGLKLEVDIRNYEGKDYRYDAHLPFHSIPPALFEALEEIDTVRPHDILEMRAQRARLFTPSAPDTAAENTQLDLLAASLGIQERGAECLKTLSSLIEKKDFRLLDCLTTKNRVLYLPAGFFEAFREIPVEINGKSKIDSQKRTMQWFEFIEAIATRIADPKYKSAETQSGRAQALPGLPHNHSLKQADEAWGEKTLDSDYYPISQMLESGLRYGSFGDDVLVARADVGTRQEKNNREVLGIYSKDGHAAKIILCPERHLNSKTAAFSEFSQIPKLTSKNNNLSLNKLQLLEIWFRPYKEFIELKGKAKMALETLRKETNGKDISEVFNKSAIVQLVLERMERTLQAQIPDFRAEQEFDYVSLLHRGDIDGVLQLIEKSLGLYGGILDLALQEASEYENDAEEYFKVLTETLVGSIRRVEVTHDAELLEYFRENNVRHNPALFESGETFQVLEPDRITDAEIAWMKAMLRLDNRDYIHAVMGSQDFIPLPDQVGTPEGDELDQKHKMQQERYREVIGVLASIEGDKDNPTPNIVINGNHSGAGHQASFASLELRAKDPKKNYPPDQSRIIGIEPSGALDYPGNESLIKRPDGLGWWAAGAMDLIALNSRLGYRGRIEDETEGDESQINHEDREEYLIRKLSKGQRRIGFYADGGLGTVSKLAKFCEKPGPVIIYGGLGKFGAIASRLLSNPFIPVKEIFDNSYPTRTEAEKDKILDMLFTALQSTGASMMLMETETSEFYGEQICQNFGMDISTTPVPGFVKFSDLKNDAKQEKNDKGEIGPAQNKHNKMKSYLENWLKILGYYLDEPYRFRFADTPEELRSCLEKDIRNCIPNTLAEELPLPI